MDKKKETVKDEVKKVEEKETKKVENKKTKKDIIIVSVAVALVFIILIVASVVLILNNKPKELNLDELYTSISDMEPYKDMTTLEIDSYILSSLYEIDESLYEEAVGKMPMLNVQASMFLIIKANEGKVNDVKDKVDVYAKAQEESWSRYLPEQYELVKNRKSGVVGNYVYLIIGDSAEEVEKLIK